MGSMDPLKAISEWTPASTHRLWLGLGGAGSLAQCGDLCDGPPKRETSKQRTPLPTKRAAGQEKTQRPLQLAGGKAALLLGLAPVCGCAAQTHRQQDAGQWPPGPASDQEQPPLTWQHKIPKANGVSWQKQNGPRKMDCAPVPSRTARGQHDGLLIKGASEGYWVPPHSGRESGCGGPPGCSQETPEGLLPSRNTWGKHRIRTSTWGTLASWGDRQVDNQGARSLGAP